MSVHDDAPGDAYRTSSIAVNSNDVSLAMIRPEGVSDETKYFDLCATTNLAAPQCWQSIAYCTFPAGATNMPITLSRGLLGGYGISNLCCFTFIESGDDDGDGLDNWFERLVHRTDPYNADSDMDGLTDFDELYEYGTDPLNPRSISDVCCDGYALLLGDDDPFSIPIGSTNTLWEHLFYVGTAYAQFSYPTSSAESSVLRVTATGSGSGELLVGDRIVPLLVPAPTESMPDPSMTLMVSLAKGEDIPLVLRCDDTLSVSLDSDDFAFGELPSRSEDRMTGYINFPNSVATPACIHDFNLRRVEITLPTGRGAADLVCTWDEDGSVAIVNAPPRSAVVHGDFPVRATRQISYTLHHPKYLFGQTEFSQTVRFCPRPPDPSPGDDPDPPWFAVGYPLTWESHLDDDYCWCCHWGTCGADCDCGCIDCPGNDAGDDWYDSDICPEHLVEYSQCSSLHETECDFARLYYPHLADVIKIRDPVEYETIHLDVPSGHPNCCPCPDHWENYVGVSLKSPELRLVDGDGVPFNKTEESCDVFVACSAPSREVGDFALVFNRSGEIYNVHNFTALGVSIEGAGDRPSLSFYNAMAPAFGYPFTVTTNAVDGAELYLRTRVGLRDGNIHLEFRNATSQFSLWIYDSASGEFRKLLDTNGAPVLELPMARWRRLAGEGSDPATGLTPVFVTSSKAGHVDLVYRYWAEIDGAFVEDTATQCITSVNPPILPDYNRDGAIDAIDVTNHIGGAVYRFWYNQDTDKGDYVGQILNRNPNTWYDLHPSMKGRYDLLNLFPVAFDFRQFVLAYGYSVNIRIGSGSRNLRYCAPNLAASNAGDVYRSAVRTFDNELLSDALMYDLPASASLDDLGVYSPVGMLAFEAVGAVSSITAEVVLDGKCMYSFELGCSITSVRDMYRWINARHFSDGNEVRATSDGVPANNPESAEAPRKLFFLHGANVSESDAGKWGDQVFKRLWVSGAKMDFYNVGWRSDIGSSANYHQNASNAFEVAARLAPVISAIPGEKVMMAHSLGNMVVSSMIQDHGLVPAKYLMCNSAVPAEAYDTDPSLRVPQLVHPDWEEYPTNSWAASWHSLFDAFPNDDRRLLGWPGRFADVAQYAVNFYSTGDEVLELYPGNNIGFLDGATSLWTQYCWHHQEIYKGRGGWDGMGATTWSGWGFATETFIPPFSMVPITERVYLADAAAQLSDTQIRERPVFNPNPSSITNAVIPLLVRAAHLTHGIPALTPSAGKMKFGDNALRRNSFDCNSESEIARPKFWPSGRRYGDRWMHSDMKDVAYFYIQKFYEKVIEKGMLK